MIMSAQWHVIELDHLWVIVLEGPGPMCDRIVTLVQGSRMTRDIYCRRCGRDGTVPCNHIQAVNYYQP